MERTHLVLDIETVLDAELPIPENGETEGLPPPPHHEIVCIGVLWFGANYEVRKVGIIGEEKPEPDVLADFSRFLERQRPVLVTFNGRGFDLPVIAARCFKHGQPLGYYYRERNVRYRFSVDGHMDLMDFLSDFGAAKRSRLDLSARLCGMPGKVGIDGKDVGPMVHAGRLAEVRAYCLCDVVQTAGVFLRTQLVRSEITREQYLEAMAGLMRAALNDRRLDPVTAAWNETRLLMGTRLADHPLPEGQERIS